MKAVFLDYATVGSPELDLTPLTDLFPDIEFFDSTSSDQVAARIESAEIVFCNKVRLSQEIIKAAPQLRFIGLPATGTDNIAIEAAESRGIAVSNIRAYCTQSVVEHIFGTLLNLAHSLTQYRNDVRAGDWQKARDFCLLHHPVRELSAMTIGIVGHGNLGKAVAAMARNFNMTVLISARPGTKSAAGDGRTDFAVLLRESDVISLHCPLTAATRGLIGADELTLMKDSAILINTARGALIDSAALVKALANGDIAAAAIDVLTTEPPAEGDSLLDYDGDNLFLTPHIAWATLEARQNAINELAANAAAFVAGKERNRVI